MDLDMRSLGKAYGISNIAGGSAGLLSNLFGGDPGKPYSAGMNQLTKYSDQAASYQNPFYNAGVNAIPQYQSYLSKMSDPTQFINDIMGDYSESPYAEYEQQQSMRSANNMASASGLTGSSALQLQEQQNAEDISNQDMETWLNHVLGINTQYGQGLTNEISSGQQSANQLSKIYESLGREMAKGMYGKTMAQQKQGGDIFGDIGALATGAGLLYFL